MPSQNDFIKPLLPVDSVSRNTILPQEGTKTQAEISGPHREIQPALVCLKTAGGKSEPGEPARFTPRPVGCSGRNRGPGSLLPKTKWLPFWCQCHDCLETFSVDGLVSNGELVKLEEHPRIGYRRNGTYYHRCGGNGTIGHLMIYPTLKLWSS